MSTTEFFHHFWQQVRETENWKTMEKTIEDSPWHREANVAVHTSMTITQYMQRFVKHRADRQTMLTLMALLFHDFGKPEAEEVLEKKTEPGVFYRRYAGHEPVSANEFMSFMCDNHELREAFFEQGYSWKDIRTIKVMIEHHLPYGLKNEQKRKNLKQMVDRTFGEDEVCFYDMLRCDAAGRISDDHEVKLQNVEDWIKEFQAVEWTPRPRSKGKALVLLVGVSGAGKSTFVNKAKLPGHTLIFSEDELRVRYAEAHLDKLDEAYWPTMTEAEKYAAAFKFCHLTPGSKFDAHSKAAFHQMLSTEPDTLIIDRMNTGRKSRSFYIEAARQKGYKVTSIEFPISAKTAIARQKTRGDKEVPAARVRQFVMSAETPWLGVEVDDFVIIAPAT